MARHGALMAWFLTSCLLVAALALPAVAEFPQAGISNGRIRATMYLPDAASGYYRGTRFDWSGAISSLTWNGHEYFGPWFDRHDPLVHDAITGPVEEFLTGSSSVGYDEARPGESFVRIGVGAVKKPDEPAYRRFATYEIADPGRWTISRTRDAVAFVHALGDTNGYAYEYRKTVRLAGDTLVLDHQLKNTGRKRIVTEVYNHNFFTLDRQPTGPDIVVRFPFDVKAERPLQDLAEITGRELRFLRRFEPGQTVFTELRGYGPTARDYDFRIEHRRTGAGVRITADRPLSSLVFWSAARTVCPEPYVDATVDPGRESSWRIVYEFYDASRRDPASPAGR
jgi:hypothetical protein